ncbi:hypothetical protein IAR50_005148 [Cryptococcus sp. DSM 104548]
MLNPAQTSPLTTLDPLPNEVRLLVYGHLRRTEEKPVLAKLAGLSRLHYADIIPDLFRRARWLDMPMRERRSPVTRRIYLNGLVETVTIQDAGALFACFKALRTLKGYSLPGPSVRWYEENHLHCDCRYSIGGCWLFHGLLIHNGSSHNMASADGLHLPDSLFASLKHTRISPDDDENIAPQLARTGSTVTISDVRHVSLRDDVDFMMLCIADYAGPHLLALHDMNMSKVDLGSLWSVKSLYARMKMVEKGKGSHEKQLKEFIL